MDFVKENKSVYESENNLPLLEKIRVRKNRLINAGNALKNHFVGLDKIIDEIIRNIEVWYILPELITRPVIVNLWGMTGVGKTDLVRRLVKLIEMNDRFLEIQLSNGSDSYYNTTIKSTMSCSNLEPKKTGILLLDELQRFRTVDENGEEILENSKYHDIWMLLSDGKFAAATDKEELMKILFDRVLYSVDDDEDQNSPVEVPKKRKNRSPKKTKLKNSGLPKAGKPSKHKNKKYHQPFYTAKMLKRILKLDDPVEEIMLWTEEKKIKTVISKIYEQETYEGDDYSKLLIFISGNLDEAFSMARNCSDADSDADVLHKHSLNVNFVDIKHALLQRFKPEQISRLGNTHIIYPSLSKKSYQTIIQKRMQNLIDSVKKNHNMDISFDYSVNEFVYRNGVFPAQGVRPVFSTISSFVENAVPNFMFYAIQNNKNNFKVRYEEKKLVATFENNVEISNICIGPIDEIKSENQKEKIIQTSVHEAGHIVSYIILFDTIPTQAVSNSTKYDAEGFVGLHNYNQTYDFCKKSIVVNLAGTMAEQIVFGKNYRSSGASQDIYSATSLTSFMIREWGMGENISRIAEIHADDFDKANNNNTKELNDLIEKIMSDSLKEAKSILEDNAKMFVEFSDLLISKNKLSPEEMLEVAVKHGHKPKIVDNKIILFNNFEKMYKEYLENIP